MELSYFLAQLFGLTLIVLSGALFLRPTIVTVAMRDLRPFSFTMLMAGFFGVVGGLSIILTHNIWELSWRSIITLFGWLALIKGIVYIAFPDLLRYTALGMVNGNVKRKGVCVFVLLLGLYLAIKGFGLR